MVDHRVRDEAVHPVAAVEEKCHGRGVDHRDLDAEVAAAGLAFGARGRGFGVRQDRGKVSRVQQGKGTVAPAFVAIANNFAVAADQVTLPVAQKPVMFRVTPVAQHLPVDARQRLHDVVACCDWLEHQVSRELNRFRLAPPVVDRKARIRSQFHVQRLGAQVG